MQSASVAKKGAGIVVPFMLITMCFAMWGFANDITNPMVKAFSKIFRMSVTEGAFVQLAFYGGYFAMAIPAALYIRRHTYKAGVMMGLALYALGALLFIPARESGVYFPFLLAYFVMTCGLSFLETSCNPYILAMGPKETSIRRLNLAQAFNPIGSLAGMFVAMHFIQSRLDPAGGDERAVMSAADFEAVKAHDLAVLTAPYVAIGVVILLLLLCIAFTRMPEAGHSSEKASGSVKRLLANRPYVAGVVTQFFYVGAQIMMWTFIIQYGTRIFMAEGMAEQQAEVLSQRYNIVAMAIFCASRFICTYAMRYVSAPFMLRVCAAMAALLTAGVVFVDGVAGLWCLVGVSAFMSLMFPTIYGIALRDVEREDTQFGAAGLIMAILGGSVLPPLQASIIDLDITQPIPSVNLSFLLPLICFAVIFLYATATHHRSAPTP